MKDRNSPPTAHIPFSRIMDIRMIATTLGGASLANTLFPNTGIALLAGLLLGALAGLWATSTH